MGTKCALLMILAGSALAQTPAINLRIETASGRTQFRMGEAISMKLTFDNPPAEMWTLPGLSGTDRSPLGLGRDRFPVSPEQGTSDPLGYQSGQGGGGSILGSVYPGEKPISMSVDLNQWIRFDRAGQYQVSALLHARVGSQEVVLNSSAIGIEIIPADNAWSAEQLRQAVAVLSAPGGIDQRTFDARATAVRTIWYLDTPESVREAARLIGALDEQTGRPLQKALLGSRHQDVAIASMKQDLGNPNQPVSQPFLATLRELEVRQQVPLPAGSKADEAAARRRGEAYAATEKQLQAELAGVIERKRSEAKAISIDTLLNGTRFDAITANMRGEVADVFLDLPWRQQNDLLGGQWKRIAGPAMIPVLREIYENPPQAPPQQSLAPAAVQRLYELDRDRTRTLILDDMKRDTPRLPFATLAILDDATLPEMDSVLLDKWEHDRAQSDPLLARYATADILADVKAIEKKRGASPACRPGLIAYYLRVDPAWGERALRQVLGERSNPQGGCWTQILGSTAQYHAGPEWEKVASEALVDGVVAVKWDAARAMREHGSAAAQQAVMGAFRAWHDWWKDRPAEMTAERQLEQALYQAAAEAKNWVADAEQLEKIRDYCITASCRGQVEQDLAQWKDTVTIWVGSSNEGDVSVSFAQYGPTSLDAARARLIEIPAGSRVKWHFNVPDMPAIEAWVASINQEMAARGVVVTP